MANMHDDLKNEVGIYKKGPVERKVIDIYIYKLI